MTQDMGNKMIIEENIFPGWEQNIPGLGTNHSQGGNEIRTRSLSPYVVESLPVRRVRTLSPSCSDCQFDAVGLRSLRYIVCLLLMMFVGVGEMWGQQMTDFEGVWYIASNGNAYKAGTTTNLPYTYSSATPESNFYLRPAADPQIADETDAFFDGTAETKPFLTSNKTGHTDIALWILKKTTISYTTSSGSDYYYTIQHAETGKYVVCDPFFSGTLGDNNDSRRKSMHLETKDWTTTIPNKALFKIRYTADESTAEDNSDSYCFIPKLVENKSRKYWNIADRNQPVNYGTKSSQYYGGLVGLYTFGTTPANVVDINSRFKFEPYEVAQPTITFNNATNEVTITSSVTGAKIYYTTNGDTPTSELTAHTSPVTFTQTTPCTINAIAVRSWNSGVDAVSSDEKTYNLQKVATPTITFNADNSVTIACDTEGATIYYTTDGNTPTTSSTVYTVPLTEIAPDVTIQAIAVIDGMINSAVGSGSLVIDPPTITENCDNTFSLSCGNIPSASIYYNLTTNGDVPADPTTGSTLYDGTPIPFGSGYKVKAKAIVDNKESEVASYTFTALHTAAPTISYNSTTITITGPEGSTIYYTTNGNDPEIGGEGVTSHATPAEIAYDGSSEVEVLAIAKESSLKASCVTRLVTISTPTLTVTNPSCSVTNQVSITGADDGRTFWYAYTAGNNSAAPAKNTFTQYTDAFSLTNFAGISGTNAYYTVHAYAKSSDGQNSSNIVSVSHQMKTPGTPTLIAPTGSSSALEIEDGVAGDKAVCSYTDNQGTPNVDSDDQTVTNNSTTIGSDGTATFNIPSTAIGTLTVSFKRGEWLASCEATYTIPDAPPIPTWSQDSNNKLSLSCEDEMAVIHYTTDGSVPTMSSPTYSNGCLDNIAVGTTVKAIAVRGFRTSGVMEYTYQYTHVEAPDFFIDGTTVTITVPGNPEGVTIYYTTDDSDPTDTSNPNRHVYDSENPITITGGGVTTPIKAYAVKEGMGASSVVRVVTREGYSIRNASDLAKLSAHPSGYFFILDDINAAGFSGTVASFSGVLDGGYHTISNLSVPLFNEISSSDSEHNAAVHDVIFDKVGIDISGNAGAVAQTATGYTRIYNCGVLSTDEEHPSEIKGSANVGGIVGEISGTARVINCFSYANITGGSYRGGIVGKNDGTSTWRNSSSNITTMVMNCMFYGDISTTGSPTQIAPIYGGTKISNTYTASVTDGLNNFNYFRFNSPYMSGGSTITYNCALGAEDRFLNRFEFFRQTLNSTRDLAAWYVSNTVADKELMGKWVLDKTIAPYPILKEPGTYPSVINPDAEHGVAIDADNVHRNEGRKLGTLSVTIDLSSSPSGVKPLDINGNELNTTSTSRTLVITDKDFENFNFNYKKVQLPYYNKVGTGNYTNNKVVTGWKIVYVGGSGTQGTFTTGTDVVLDESGAITSTPYNFADRNTYAKDLYSGSSSTDHSGRVFNQGAYWEVPEGVTSITIEPYWADCVYLADANYDVTYSGSTAKPIGAMGSRTYDSQLGNNPTVYNDISTALGQGTSASNVYDFAIVLVGNYHHCFGDAVLTGTRTAPLTIMSADFDNDNEPDYTFFYQHSDRRTVAPLRFDFINIPGIGMVQKADGAESNFQLGIFRPKGWFEITNTVNIQFYQFEYADGQGLANKESGSPVILQGGIYEQFVSGRYSVSAGTQYLLIGGNAWFKTFANGCHTKITSNTPKIPISVTGGDYENFYLSGIYSPGATTAQEGAECYIDGGRFGEVAGAGMQKIDGNVTWLINGADITRFYGGGINADKAITGNIYTSISNSHVGEFCGGPKFGDMKGVDTPNNPNDDKTVTTIATNCDFTTFYGAGHGGTAYFRYGHQDQTFDGVDKGEDAWNSWVSSHYNRAYNNTDNYKGISTSYEYEYVFFSGGGDRKKVARFFTNYASVSLANTNSVSSTLTGCKLGNFYGGGKLGAVKGNAISILTDCEVRGNAYGAGFSAAAPTVDVTPRENSGGTVGFEVAPSYDNSAGVFNDEQVDYPTAVTYTWKYAASVTTGNEFEEVAATETTPAQHYILTTENLDGLGKVNGTASLTINGKSTIGTLNASNVLEEGTGNVYGGGELSNVDNTAIVIDGRTKVLGSVYGGGKGKADNFTCDKAMVGIEGAGADPEHYPNYQDGTTSVSINNGTVEGSVYGGGEVGRVEMNTTVTIGDDSDDNSMPIINGSVFGGGKGVETHGYSALVRGNPTVTVQAKSKVRGNVYGGGQIASVARYNVAKDNNEGAPYGVLKDMPYALKTNDDGTTSGYCTVTVKGNAEIGPETIDSEAKTTSVGHVFGAGKGILPGPGGDYAFVEGTTKRMIALRDEDGKIIGSDWDYFTATGEAGYITFVKTLALSSQTDVTIEENAKVKGSVYGGSESGFVQFDTKVTVTGGAIGTQNHGGADFGNVYGGGKGDAEHTGSNENYLEAGIVKGDTEVKIQGGTILHNIYGGGAYGTVGEFAYDNETGLPTGRRTYTITEGVDAGVHETTGGNTKIEITGGEIGTNGNENGMIFGSSRGDVGNTTSIHNKLAWVYKTEVKIGTEGSGTGPQINGSVYGGGENGHVFNDADVYIYSGTVGITSGSELTFTENSVSVTKGGAGYPYRGNVYGGGCGTDKYYSNPNNLQEGHTLTDGNGDTFNPLAGIVQGDATITMTGGQVVHNVYGAGAMGSVGTETTGGQTTIAISGGTVGVDGQAGEGNVFGAARGSADDSQYTLAVVSGNTNVSITGGTMFGSVYGGGELGYVGIFTSEVNPATNSKTYTWTKGGTCNVTINGGTASVKGNVFGAGKGSHAKYECEPAMVLHANVTINNGTVEGTVYGGGEVGRVDQNTTVTIGIAGDTTKEPDIKDDVFGAGAGVDTHGYSALVRGNSSVTIQGKAKVAKSVYGGGETASVGRFKVDAATSLPTKPVKGGICTVTIKDNASIGYNGGGNVYGACKGVEPENWETLPGHVTGTSDTPVGFTSEEDYLNFLKTLALTSNTEVTIGGSATINGSVFGGGQRGVTLAGVKVNMTGGSVTGDVYGGGALADTNTENWSNNTLTKYHEETRLTPTYYQAKPVEENESVEGLYERGGSEGAYTYTLTEDETALDGKTYYENLGSSLAGYYTESGGKYTLLTSGTPEENVTYYRFTDTKVNILGGTIGGNVYGGALGRLESGTEGEKGYESPVEAYVWGDVLVNLNGFDNGEVVYNAATHGTNLTTTGNYYQVNGGVKGAIVNKIFGCNNLNGSPKAHVKVHVFATQNSNTTLHGNISSKFDKRPVQGENDTEDSKETLAQYLQRLINAAYVKDNNGDPTEDLLPGITASVITAAQATHDATSPAATEAELNTAITNVQQEFCKLYDVEAVYGGGNLAAYVPADPTPLTDRNDTEEYAEVVIDGCDLTSIKTVYGGGDAASAPATKVRVNGTHEIEELFGGGNGLEEVSYDGGTTFIANPGAHVGYKNYSTYNTTSGKWVDEDDAKTASDRDTNYGYGDGTTTIEVTGGTIHAAYGGSNTKGNIRAKATSSYQDAGVCELVIDETYGGGKNSPMDAEIDVQLDCVQNMDEIFGGSKNADVDNSITLNITNGKFKKVFGGNNTSGAINGSITVNIEEKGCQPIEIDELYLGGYLAPYSKYGYVKDNNGDYVYYQVNADNQFIKDGNGDYIEGTAENGQLMPRTKADYDALTTAQKEAENLTTPRNDPRLNVISATYIGDIYGGGYKATIVGNPYVNVNMTEGKVTVNRVEVTKTEVSKKAVTKRAKTNEDNTELTITEGETTYVFVNNTVFYDPAKVYTDNSGENPAYYVYYTVAETIETVYDPAKVEKGVHNYIYLDDASHYYDPTKVYPDDPDNPTKYYVYTDIHNSPFEPTTGDDSTGTLEIGTIDNIYGGGNQADVIGNTNVEIGTGRWITAWENGYPVYETEYIDTDDDNKVKNLYYKEKSHAVYYTSETASTHNAGLEGALNSTGALSAEEAEAYNSTIHPETAKAEGDHLTAEEAASYNAKLPGAVRVGDVETPAVWAWYTYTKENGYEEVTGVTEAPIPTRNAATITGNVYGGGKGVADNFYCNKAMVGIDGAGVDKVNFPDGYHDGNTNVTIANGTVGTIENGTLKPETGNVYGGGKIGRVEMNTTVTIGLGDGVDETTETPTSAPVILGDVYGGGMGVKTHGYSALVRGNPTVVVQGNAKVRGSVFGAGEIASVARYKVKTEANDPDAPVGWPIGSPYALKDANSGFCKVTIGGYAEIGPEEPMLMVTASGMPDDAGHVFGAGMGVLPDEYTYEDDNHRPSRENISSWEYFTNEAAYIGFIQTLGLASETDVTIKDHAFVKGSVYGGAFNGIVQYNTHVTIEGDCQIGAGKEIPTRYPEEYFSSNVPPIKSGTVESGDAVYYDLECASWPYQSPYRPYDIFDEDANNDNKPKNASDGHTFFGNVFGGGSGYYPYRRKSEALDGAAWTKNQAKTDEIGQPVDANGYSDGVWLRTAGIVRGNTTVDITGGHILTSVYGGNEQTDVLGSTTVNMSGGTLGVPRTLEQIAAHPVTCYLFGAGKGDPRINFNTWTNVASADISITGGWIYGSVFGGGEDGHVLGDVEMTISGSDPNANNDEPTYTDYFEGRATKIGTWGTSYVEGNVFGGGRGFTGDAQTAGSVSGNVRLTISGGEMLGSIYGGGRLASVGTSFEYPTLKDGSANPAYGNFIEDNVDLFYTQIECDDWNPTIEGYIPAGTALTAAQATAYNAAMSASLSAGATLTEDEALAYNKTLPGYRETTTVKAAEGTHSHGHITVNISGGRIGNTLEDIVPNTGTPATEEAAAIPSNIPTGLDNDFKKWTDDDWTTWQNYNHVPQTLFDKTTGVASHTTGGNVFGGSMGRLKLLNGSVCPIWPKMAMVKTTAVNIYGNAVIMKNVYAGGELGTVRNNACVVIGGYMNPEVTDGTLIHSNGFNLNPVAADSIPDSDGDYPIIRRDVYGGGYGSEDDDTRTVFTVMEPKQNLDHDPNPSNPDDYEEHTYGFTPMLFAGCVGQNSFVHIKGGYIRKSVYGGGEMASVGIINSRVKEVAKGSIKDEDVVFLEGDESSYVYEHFHKHGDADHTNKSFALSWPYHFEYTPTFEGATHVTVEGGRLGLKANDEDDTLTDNGDVYGACKGVAGDYQHYVFCANVGSTEVNINYPTDNSATPTNYMNGEDPDVECVAGAVYGGGEDGHVMGNTKITLTNGLVAHSMYGGGSGKGQFKTWLTEIPEERRNILTDVDGGGEAPETQTNAKGETEYKATCYSITAGKVFGNTNVEMKGGYVMRNIYGGGNMGSVGKGNYAGGSDDYSTAGYGETLNGNDDATKRTLWDGNNTSSQAFLNSGKCTVKVTGGTIGYVDANDPSKSMYPLDSKTKLPYAASLPYGNIFGGCRGESAPNILESPRYLYSPEFFVGYANEASVTIGKTRADFESDEAYTTYLSSDNDDNIGKAGYAPLILGSVYGGGMDGHIRRDASVTINSGVIGLAYNPENRKKLKTITLSGTETPTEEDLEIIADHSDLDNIQWLARGNVYGAGSGIGKYKYDINYDGDYDDEVAYKRPGAETATPMKEEDYSTSAGSVTRFTTVTINGGKIHRNVYGGGSLSTVGAPKIPVNRTDDPDRKGATDSRGVGYESLNRVNIAGTIGTHDEYEAHYGGEVYGASRGIEELDDRFSNAVWTEVNVKDGANIQGNVFGGGDNGPVKKDTEVNVGVSFSTDAEDMDETSAAISETFNITTDGKWEVYSNASWLTVSKNGTDFSSHVSGKGDGTNTTITVKAAANTGEGAAERTATITITGAGEPHTITVTQAAPEPPSGD